MYKLSGSDMDNSEIVTNVFMGGQMLPILDNLFDAVVNLRFLEDLALPLAPKDFAQEGPVCLWMPLVDEPVPPPDWKIYVAASFVHKAVTAGKRCLVHCAEGRNRSGLVVAAYLKLFGGLTADAAIALVREKRKITPPALENQTFVDMIRRI